MAYEGRITGQNAIVKVPSGTEIHVTNVSFDIDGDSTEVQTNQGLKSRIAVTSLTYSGSFEYEGAQDSVRDALLYTASDSDVTGGSREAGEPKRFTMTVKEEDPDGSGDGLPRTWTLDGCILTSMSRDIPSDDVPSTSIDFSAEDAYVSSGGESSGGARTN